MATLTALKFPTADGARGVLNTLESLQQQQLITIHDAAIVRWPADKRKPKTEQLHNMAGAGAMSGAFWGMLFGLLFFVPLLGAAVGAAMGGLSGSCHPVVGVRGWVGSLSSSACCSTLGSYGGGARPPSMTPG